MFAENLSAGSGKYLGIQTE